MMCGEVMHGFRYENPRTKDGHEEGGDVGLEKMRH